MRQRIRPPPPLTAHLRGGTGNALLGNTNFVNGGYDTNLETAGTTDVAGAGSGSYFVAADAILDFVGGYDFGAGTRITGTGTVRNLAGNPSRILGDMTLEGVRLENAGLIRFEAPQPVSINVALQGGATLHNLSGGTIAMNRSMNSGSKASASRAGGSKPNPSSTRPVSTNSTTCS